MADRERWGVVLAGVGGQGLVFLGNVLGRAAVVHGGLNAVVTQSYGIATRGGFTKSEVVLGRSPIAYPRVQEPDCVLALTHQAAEMYHGKLKPGSLLIFDRDQAAIEDGPAAVGLPFSSTAAGMGLHRSANVMALGAMVKILGMLPCETVEEVLRPGEDNVNAFRAGCDMGLEWTGGG